jgi:small subunit ribosomal protein S4
VTVKERSLEVLPIQHAVDTLDRTPPEWLEVDAGERRIVVQDLPSRQQIDTQIQEQLIVELYSK